MPGYQPRRDVLPPSLARLASRNHGVVGRRQLREAGLSAKRERGLRERRQLQPVLGHTSVVAGQPVTVWQRASAAYLICRGVASHATAAELHAMPTARDRRTHCIVVATSHLSVDGLAAHRTPLLDSEIEAAVSRRRGWHGTPQLTEVFRLLCDGGRSAGERLLHSALRGAGIDGWVVNVVIDGLGEVDVLFPEVRLVVEVDGFAVHNQRAAFNRDRRKGRAMVLAGYTVLHVTWDDLTRQPEAVVAQIAETRRRLAVSPA